MPEGHTLHRLAGELQELVGQRVATSSPQGRFPAAEIDGAVVAGVEAYGKHLLVDLRDAPTVHVHLGMAPDRPASGVTDACADCGTPVLTTTVQGRTVYACPRCQPG